ncbi:MAG: hypothetical protein IJT03_04570 [Clostridia bacterium]|nr:hypothetical protein [Clostridia bacterium]
MKSKFQFYKNIILVVASALTLIAVTFAWFSTPKNGNLGAFSSAVAPNALVNVNFQQDVNGNGNYTPLSGDIELDSVVAGQYYKYRIILQTVTDSPLSITMSIDDLPSNLPADLKSSVNIKYVLKKVTANPDGTYTDGTTINASSDYVNLSSLTDGYVFSLSLKNYQTSSSDCFAIYYEIGLSENSPSTIEGKSASLGSVSIIAQQTA